MTKRLCAASGSNINVDVGLKLSGEELLIRGVTLELSIDSIPISAVSITPPHWFFVFTVALILPTASAQLPLHHHVFN
jgi:hypothetical protein